MGYFQNIVLPLRPKSQNQLSMSNNYFQNRYRIPSVRAAWHNYNGGLYFVTICTHGREHHFGGIVAASTSGEPQMVLSPIGQFADEQFRNVHTHYPYAEIPLWVVMPDHIHAIVGIDPNVGMICAGDTNNVIGTNTVETMCTSSLHLQQRQSRWKREQIDEKMQMVSLRRGKLSVTIGGLKRAITRFAHQNHLPFAWQTRFHDRIIRNTDELNRITNYIVHNVEAEMTCREKCGDVVCDDVR